MGAVKNTDPSLSERKRCASSNHFSECWNAKIANDDAFPENWMEEIFLRMLHLEACAGKVGNIKCTIHINKKHPTTKREKFLESTSFWFNTCITLSSQCKQIFHYHIRVHHFFFFLRRFFWHVFLHERVKTHWFASSCQFTDHPADGAIRSSSFQPRGVRFVCRLKQHPVIQFGPRVARGKQISTGCCISASATQVSMHLTDEDALWPSRPNFLILSQINEKASAGRVRS